MPSRVIRDAYQFDELVKFLGDVKLPLTVSWVKGADRSDEQNALMWMWANEVAYQLQDREAADVQAEWKLRIGVPILRSENDAWRAKYDAMIKPLPYDMKIDAMRDFFPVTSVMKVRQMSKFLNQVQQQCVERGLQLTQPPEDLDRYNRRYGQ